MSVFPVTEVVCSLPVKPLVLLFGEQPQVAQPIVITDVVPVVHDLAGFEIAPNLPRHYDVMLPHVAAPRMWMGRDVELDVALNDDTTSAPRRRGGPAPRRLMAVDPSTAVARADIARFPVALLQWNILAAPASTECAGHHARAIRFDESQPRIVAIDVAHTPGDLAPREGEHSSTTAGAKTGFRRPVSERVAAHRAGREVRK